MTSIAIGFLVLVAFMLIMVTVSPAWRSTAVAWALAIYFSLMAIICLQVVITDSGLDDQHIAVYRWIQLSQALIVLCSFIFGITLTRQARAERRRQEQEEDRRWHE